MVKLTKKEKALLDRIVGEFNENSNLCFTEPLTDEEKGVLSSLIKKGLVYNGFDDDYLAEIDRSYDRNNFFPTEDVLANYGITTWGQYIHSKN